MNTAIKKAKKTLAVILCVLMISAFAVPFAGAEGTINWEVNEDGYTVTVPSNPGDEAVVVTLPEAKAKVPDGTEGEVMYSLVIVNGDDEVAVSETLLKDNFGFSKDKPEITVDNSSKDYVYIKSNGTGAITLGMRAVCGELQSDICLIKVENYKVKATFSYLNNDDKYCDRETEVFYGNSVKEFADGISDYKLPENDKNCHYIKNGWVDFLGKSTIESVREDTTFVLSVSSEAHDIDPDITDYDKKEPTCTEDGYIKGYCGYCAEQENGYKELIQIDFPALGHNLEVTKEGKDPSCFEDGYTEEKTCRREGCGYVEKSKPISAIGYHTPVTDSAVEPTCTKPGLTEGSHCKICGEVFAAQKVVPAKEHKFEDMPEKAPTCTEVGYKAGNRCTVCGAPKSEDMIIPALNHQWESIPAVDPTCTEKGKTEGKKCSVCGEILVEPQETPALNHDKDEASIIKAVAPTCTTEGSTEGFYCKRCKKTIEPQTIEKLPHTEVIDAAVAATCTEKGKTQGKHCSVCNTITVPQTETDALGHDMVVTKEGYEETCTEKGFTDEKKCSRCGVVEEQTEIPPKGHSLVTEYGRDATCTEDGESDCVFCTVCGHVEKEREVIKNFGGHKDLDNDGFCDRCGTEVEKPQSGNTCGCICHKGGIVGWLWKSILCPIIKFLGIEQKCKCGVDHWTK